MFGKQIIQENCCHVPHLYKNVISWHHNIWNISLIILRSSKFVFEFYASFKGLDFMILSISGKNHANKQNTLQKLHLTFQTQTHCIMKGKY